MSEKPEKSQYTVDVMIEIVRKNINRSAEMAMDGRLDMGCTGALITIAQGLNILARQFERAWEEKNKYAENQTDKTERCEQIRQRKPPTQSSDQRA